MSEVLSSRDLLLAASKRRLHRVSIPEFEGAEVCLRTLSAADRLALRAKWAEADGKGDSGSFEFQCTLVSKCLVDSEGNRIFKDDDAQAIGELDARVLDNLALEAVRISGLSQQASDQAVKNSEPSPSATSVSP